MKRSRLLSVLFSVLVIVVALAVSVGAAKVDENGNWTPENTTWEALARDEHVLARFAMSADLHYGADAYYPAAKLEAIYNAIDQIGGVDMFAISGDVTDHGLADELRGVMNIIKAHTSDPVSEVDGVTVTGTGDDVTTTLLCMGNHEYKTDGANSETTFSGITGQDVCGLYWINGVPVIKMSPTSSEEGNSYHGREAFILGAFEAIDNSGYDGIIVGMSHHRPPTSKKTTSNSTWSEAELNAFKAHKNFVLFTGHSHSYFYNSAEFIEQVLGFTHVRSGVAAHYWGPDTGVVNPVTGREGLAFEENAIHSCSFVLIDVMDDGTARIRRVDVSKGEYAFGGEDWIVDPDSMIYLTNTKDGNYGAASTAPSFPDGAEISVADEGNHDTVIVSFPAASPASDKGYDYIWRYRITLTDGEGNTITREVMNDSLLTNNRERTSFSVPVTGLLPDTDYTLTVSAMTGYKIPSADYVMSTIAYDGTVNVGHVETTYPPVPVLDVDMSDGEYADACGHAVTEKPFRMKFYDVDEIGKKALGMEGFGAVGYEFTREDFDRIKLGFTYEAYFMCEDTEPTQFVLGSITTLNSGFRIQDGYLYLWGNFRSINDGSMEKRLVAGAEIEDDVWYHAVAVYNGAEVRLYLNGELVDTGRVTGGLNDPADEENDWAVFIGDLASSEQSLHYLMDTGYVNMVRIWEGAMTDEDVTAAYEAATAVNAPIPLVDIGNIWRDLLLGVPAPFTAEVNPNEPGLADQMEIAEEKWTGKNTGTVNALTAGEDGNAPLVADTYEYEITLRAKDGYVFADGFRFIYGGTEYAADKLTYTISDGGRTITLSGAFCPPVTVGEAVDTSTIFKDVKSKSWFKKAVDFVYNNKLMNGMTDTTFAPNEAMSRAMLVTVLWRAEGSPAPAGTTPFTDLKAKWYKDAVAWAYENEIVKGMTATTFDPNAPLSREQIAAIMYRYSEYRGADVSGRASLDGFPDGGKTHNYAKDA
ncbi:MAG: S-layer homology domain-containing protein, partial [Clostridia bacterium]|nr:S-layer homology domain-containing protein [Clostridia bacterium]